MSWTQTHRRPVQQIYIVVTGYVSDGQWGQETGFKNCAGLHHCIPGLKGWAKAGFIYDWESQQWTYWWSLMPWTHLWALVTHHTTSYTRVCDFAGTSHIREACIIRFPLRPIALVSLIKYTTTKCCCKTPGSICAVLSCKWHVAAGYPRLSC